MLAWGKYWSFAFLIFLGQVKATFTNRSFTDQSELKIRDRNPGFKYQPLNIPAFKYLLKLNKALIF